MCINIREEVDILYKDECIGIGMFINEGMSYTTGVSHTLCVPVTSRSQGHLFMILLNVSPKGRVQF